MVMVMVMVMVIVMAIVMVIVFAVFLLTPSDYPFWYLQTFLNVIKRLKKRNTENDCCISIGASYPSVIQPPNVLYNMKILATALPRTLKKKQYEIVRLQGTTFPLECVLLKMPSI